MLPVILERVEYLNDHVASFSFRANKKVDYVAGMFTELYLPHTPRDDRGERRWFTLSSSPDEDLLTITTKFAEKSSSFKQQLRALQIGTPLKLAVPMGDFILPVDHTIPLVFVAGGMGITPFHSMIKWLKDNGLKRNITFIYAVRSEEDFIFKDLLDSYDMDIHYVVSNPSKTWTGLSGQLTPARVLSMIGEVGNTNIYISGPEPLVEALTDGIRATGVPKYQVITDYFPGYAGV